MSKTVRLFDFRWEGTCNSEACENSYEPLRRVLSKSLPENTKCPFCGEEMEIELYAELEDLDEKE